MPFPYDKYPWLNFQELNLAYFIKHFREIFQQWNQLYHDLLDWKDATDADLAEWKSTVEAGISSWESGLTAALEVWKSETESGLATWKTQTESDIDTWEAATLAALEAWKTATTAVFEQIRTEAAASATAAAGSASAAETAKTAAQTAQAAAEAAAASIASSAAQITENTADIAALSSSVEDLQTRVIEWFSAEGSANIPAGSSGGTISRTDICDVNIQADQPFSILFSDPDNTIISDESGNKLLNFYYRDDNGSYHSLGNYYAGVIKTRMAPENITRLAIYRSAGTTGNAGTISAVVKYRKTTSDLSIEYRVEQTESLSAETISGLEDIAEKSSNLFNPNAFTEGAYYNASGNIVNNASYGYTDWIPVTAGDTLYYNCGNARMLCAANRFGVVSASAGSNSEVPSGNYTVPNGIALIRLSFALASIPENPVVSVGELADYTPFDTWSLKNSAIPTELVTAIENLTETSESLTVRMGKAEIYEGPTQISLEQATLAPDTTLLLNSAPWYLKKKVSLSANFKFSSFGSVLIGKGYMSYRGKWIEIDSTNITPHSYVSEESTGTPIPHGLTISDFLQVSMYLDTDGKCYITIGSIDGTFSTNIDYLYEWNYAPFIRSSAAITDIKLALASEDLRSPLWLIGDSYMGVSVLRIGGQLKNLGYLGYCLSSVAGGSAYGSKSLYDELLRMLALSTPKFILWENGINGPVSESIEALDLIKGICEEKGITLIAAKVPLIPSKIAALQTYDDYVVNSGLRYVDEYDAVGCNSSAEWYAGFMDEDQTHPSTLGAKALAMRFIVDVPELMQYGHDI